jgi:NADPH:quinone reductase-like Zn-dependent oxidoreductase
VKHDRPTNLKTALRKSVAGMEKRPPAASVKRGAGRKSAGNDNYRRSQMGGSNPRAGATAIDLSSCTAITVNAIKPVIDKVFGLDEVHAAYKHLASGAHFGKIVIRVS